MKAGATLLLVTVLLGLGAVAGKGGKTKPASSDAQALFAAVQADDAGAIERELERSDINSRGPGGQTPLMHAVLSGKVNAVKALLKLQRTYNVSRALTILLILAVLTLTSLASLALSTG